MPQIAVFFGIIIRMYFGDHRPPHFHAEYQGERATFDFEGNLLRGNISSRTARRLIKAWAGQRRRELMTNWSNGQRGLPLSRIAPLE
jgi:Domain of unknown function (DUF4160)